MMRTLLVAVLVVAVIAVAVRWFEPRLAFFPLTGEDTTPAALGIAFHAATLTTRDARQLGAWSMERADASATVLYFHGNGGNLSVWLPVLAGIHQRRFAVYAFDYRGYGVSTGNPTEQGLYRDVEAAVDWVSREAPRDRPLVYWGRSLGATMAAYAATVRRPAGLILEAGFPDVRALLRGSGPMAVLALLSSYRFPTSSFASKAAVPTLVMHGDRDTVVPFRNGSELYERLPGPKRFVTIPGRDHNDVAPVDLETYWEPVAQFVAGLEPVVRPD
jgi:fermentation-respiration switch protein FrsA (DUF1100 family)